VFEESHELVQDLHELVDVSAGLRYEICVHFEDQVVETGAVAAKEHQSVVEGLVVLQVTETRARRGLEQFSKRMVPLVETRRVLSLLY
jgi:hypothetical protein